MDRHTLWAYGWEPGTTDTSAKWQSQQATHSYILCSAHRPCKPPKFQRSTPARPLCKVAVGVDLDFANLGVIVKLSLETPLPRPANCLQVLSEIRPFPRCIGSNMSSHHPLGTPCRIILVPRKPPGTGACKLQFFSNIPVVWGQLWKWFVLV